MKKRKKPILLVTMLIILVSCAVAFNLYQDAKPGDAKQPEAPKTDAPQVGQPHPTQTQNSVAEAVKQQQTKAVPGGSPKSPPGPMGKGMGPGGGPIVAAPKMSKPVPSDSSTSTQWYKGDTAAGSK
jgi:hypothetical protein